MVLVALAAVPSVGFLAEAYDGHSAAAVADPAVGVQCWVGSEGAVEALAPAVDPLVDGLEDGLVAAAPSAVEHWVVALGSVHEVQNQVGVVTQADGLEDEAPGGSGELAAQEASVDSLISDAVAVAVGT